MPWVKKLEPLFDNAIAKKKKKKREKRECKPDPDDDIFEGACNDCGGAHAYCQRCGRSFCVQSTSFPDDEMPCYRGKCKGPSV